MCRLEPEAERASLLRYSPECLEVEFCELLMYGF